MHRMVNFYFSLHIDIRMLPLIYTFMKNIKKNPCFILVIWACQPFGLNVICNQFKGKFKFFQLISCKKCLFPNAYFLRLINKCKKVYWSDEESCFTVYWKQYLFTVVEIRSSCHLPASMNCKNKVLLIRDLYTLNCRQFIKRLLQK